jgi:hypothetical protein
MTAAAMRQALLDSISALSLGTFSVSSELPWDAAGTPLYQKNPKVFYVSTGDSTEATLFNTMDGNAGGCLASRETVFQVFVVVDAKQTPSNYNSLVEAVENVRATSLITGVRSREVDVTTTFEADTLQTEFEFRFTEMIIN